MRPAKFSGTIGYLRFLAVILTGITGKITSKTALYTL